MIPAIEIYCSETIFRLYRQKITFFRPLFKKNNKYEIKQNKYSTGLTHFKIYKPIRHYFCHYCLSNTRLLCLYIYIYMNAFIFGCWENK